MTKDTDTPTDASPDDKIQSLERRVAELEAMTEVDSDDDGGLSLPDLLELGLTRRQALMAIALVGAGWQLGPAITKSISEPAAASHGGADLGTEENPLGEVYVEDLYNVTDNVAADSVSTDEINRVEVLDPTASDWGAAVNSKVSNMSEGDVLYVPPVTYDSSTTATIDKQIVIRGDHRLTYYGRDAHPTITRQTDDPIVETAADTGLVLEGLRFESAASSDTTPLVGVHGSFQLHHVTVAYTDHDGVQVIENSGDNTAAARIENLSGDQVGRDLLHVEGGAPNNNGWKVHIKSSTDTGRHTYYQDGGFGNNVHVQLAEGGHDSTSADGNFSASSVVWTSTTNVKAHVNYAENVDCLFNFRDSYNFGSWSITGGVTEVYRTGSVNDNWFIDYGAYGGQGSTDYRFNHQRGASGSIDVNARWIAKYLESENDVRARENNGDGLVVLDASTGDEYRIRVNNGSVEAEGPL